MKDKEFKPVSRDELRGDVYEHESFGTIGFSRCQGTSQPLFGSSIMHGQTIQLTISTARLIRNLNRDVILSDKPLVRVEMSTTQFADAITSMNSGEIPVTLKYIIGQGYVKEEPPFQNKVTQFDTEFEEKVKSICGDFDELMSVAQHSKVSQKVIKQIEQTRMRIESNMPFVKRQFSEQMEKTVTEAKGEVEAFVTGMVISYGLEAIRDAAPKLTPPKMIEIAAPQEKTDDKPS